MSTRELTAEHLAYRERIWEALARNLVEDMVLEDEPGLVHYLERLYFGEALDPQAAVLKPFLKRHGELFVLFCLQDQSPVTWDWFFTEAAPLWGCDRLPDRQLYGDAALAYRFAPLDVNPWPDPMKYGWTGEQDLAYFHYWWGERFGRFQPGFRSKSGSNPVSPVLACRDLTSGMSRAVGGTCQPNSRYTHLYEYWKNLVLTLDERLFLPESMMGDPAFKDFSRSEADMVGTTKVMLAVLFQYIDNPKKRAERGKDRSKSENAFWKATQGVAYDDDSSWSRPELVALRERLTNDVESGALPSSIAALRHWASAPRADINNLSYSTGKGEGYRDPWAPVAKTPRKSRRSVESKKVLPQSAVGPVVSRFGRYAELLEEAGVTPAPEFIEDADALATRFSAQGVKPAEHAAAVTRLAESGERTDFLALLIPEYGFTIWREPFDGFEPSDVNVFYRDLWQDVARVTAAHCTVDRVQTRRRAIADDEYDLTVEIETNVEKLKFVYRVRNSEFDQQVLADLGTFATALSLPWRFHVDDTSSEGELFVYYLPAEAGAIVTTDVDGTV